MAKRICLIAICGLPGIVFVLCSAQLIPGLPTVRAASIAGTGTLSGTVEASKPFKAAKVYATNVDKNILYMVYTAGGRYRAVDLFPGSYEVIAKKDGFVGAAKKIVIKPGATAVLDLTMQDAASVPMDQVSVVSGNRRLGQDVKLVSMDELYPPGPGRELVQKTCVVCHGRNFVALQRWNETQWNSALDLMMKGPNATAGVQIPPSSLSRGDRELLVAYLAKNYGPESQKKALKIDKEFPLDEQVLSKAEYIEYNLPLDPRLDADKKARRVQQPNFADDGNIWYTDRSIPNRIGRLDPRTGEFKDYLLPTPTNGANRVDAHDLAMDKQGQLWWGEVLGGSIGRLDPKTGEMMRYTMDETGQLKLGDVGIQVDSKQNIWFNAIYGNRLGKWDRATGKIKLWEPPTANSFLYGMVIDKKDNIWSAEFHGCKIAKFDPRTEKFTEYPALTQPCAIRRVGMDSKGTIWYGIFSAGKLGKIDPDTGNVTEYDIPMPNSEPYDTWGDREGNVWITDGGQGGTLIKFDPKTEKFTYYPCPQVTDMPKLEITRDGAIWYAPRSSGIGSVGVLYPDVDRITTLAAYR
jgi:virginiamycin B lyase